MSGNVYLLAILYKSRTANDDDELTLKLANLRTQRSHLRPNLRCRQRQRRRCGRCQWKICKRFKLDNWISAHTSPSSSSASAQLANFGSPSLANILASEAPAQQQQQQLHCENSSTLRQQIFTTPPNSGRLHLAPLEPSDGAVVLLVRSRTNLAGRHRAHSSAKDWTKAV